MEQFKVGSTFDSYEEFSNALKRYCDKKYVCFYKREARTVSAARRKTERSINPQLKYYQLKYACIKGGKEFKTMAKGQRSTSTYKSGCGAHVSLRASKCGKKLEIISLSDDHNHEVTQKLYNHLPQQRRLPEDLKSEIIQLAKLKANKKHLKSFIEDKCDKIVLLKDIHNVTSKIKNSEAATNNLQCCIQKLRDKYRADCHVLCDEDNNFKGLFFQTDHMKHYMATYPEFICMDSTYKLLDIRTPVLIVINEDGNGLTEIVAVAILVEENSETMQWFFSKFKENNPKWTDIKSVMADKDLNERRLIKLNFPDANVLICIFHVMRTFNREISANKLNVTLGQRQTALEILQKMVYSRDSATYNSLYGDLIKNCPMAIVEYFNKNWHPIKNEWTLGPNFQQSNFLNTTNNRLESLNSKIKSVVERYSTLANFIDDFFKLILIMNDERDHKAANLIYKLPVCFYEKDSVLDKYFKFLTRYAFDFVKKQFERRNIAAELDYETTILSCTCGLRSSMILPCRHILKKREELGVDLFDESLCHVRWSRKHYYNNQRLFLPLSEANNEHQMDEPSEILSKTRVKSPVVLNQHQKFNKAWLLLKSLASLISEEGNERYHCKLRQLMQLKTAWENNRDVEILENSVQIGNNPAEILTALENNLDIEILELDEGAQIVENNPDTEIYEFIQGNAEDEQNSFIHGTNNIADAEILEKESEEISNNPTSIQEPLEEISEYDANDNNTNNKLNNVANLVMPVALKKRGRPKGRNNTVIGLPAKKKNRNSIR